MPNILYSKAFEEAVLIKSAAYLEGYGEGLQSGYSIASETLLERVKEAARTIACAILRKELTVSEEMIMDICRPVLERIKHQSPIVITVHPSKQRTLERVLKEKGILANITPCEECLEHDVQFHLPNGDIEIRTEEYLRMRLDMVCETVRKME